MEMRIRFRVRCLLLSACCLLLLALTAPAFAQRDTMALGEQLGAQVIKAQAAPAEPPRAVTTPKTDALRPTEDLTIVPRPQLRSPYEKRGTK